MKISKTQLRRIIKEEKKALLFEQLGVNPELDDYTDFLKLVATDRAGAISWLKEYTQRDPNATLMSDAQYDKIVGITSTRLLSMLRDLEYFI